MCKFYAQLFSYLCLHSVNTGDFSRTEFYLSENYKNSDTQIPKHRPYENRPLYELAIKENKPITNNYLLGTVSS